MKKETMELAQKLYSEMKWQSAGMPLSLREKDAMWQEALDKAKYEELKRI